KKSIDGKLIQKKTKRRPRRGKSTERLISPAPTKKSKPGDGCPPPVRAWRDIPRRRSKSKRQRAATGKFPGQRRHNPLTTVDKFVNEKVFPGRKKCLYGEPRLKLLLCLRLVS